MDSEKVKKIKRAVQEAAVRVARDFYELQRDETGHGQCGLCENCQTSISNLASLFKKAIEREVHRLFHEEIDRVFTVRTGDTLEVDVADATEMWKGIETRIRKGLN